MSNWLTLGRRNGGYFTPKALNSAPEVCFGGGRFEYFGVVESRVVELAGLVAGRVYVGSDARHHCLGDGLSASLFSPPFARPAPGTAALLSILAVVDDRYGHQRVDRRAS